MMHNEPQVLDPFTTRESDLTTQRRKVYVAGPMRGYPLFNFPAFRDATKKLRNMGFDVVSPAEEDEKQDGLDASKHEDVNNPPHTFAFYMQRDLAIVCGMDAVAVLPGWHQSQGARLEVYVARAIGLVIFDAETSRVIRDPELDYLVNPPPDVPITHGLSTRADYEKSAGMVTGYETKSAGMVKLRGYQEQALKDVLVGIGGAPVRASTLPTEGKTRKEYPIASGLLDYFPDACCAVAHVSYVANEQHNPGKPMHWDRSKSGDEADTLGRHLLQRGGLDTDNLRHSAKMAWRAMALLQKEIEAESATYTIVDKAHAVNHTTKSQTQGMTTNIKSRTIDDIADDVHANAVAHGFHPEGQTEREFINEQVCNLIRECTELHDAWRAGNLRAPCDKADKMEAAGLPILNCAEEEYADIVIRALDQCRRLGIDISRAIEVKHRYNVTRPYKHGKLS